MNRPGIEARLLNDYQRGFPLEPAPFARIAADLGVSESAVLEVADDLLADGKISRIGAIVRPNSIGSSTLAAIAVPEQRLDDVAALVSAYSEVNHCYQREHAVNLWFVVTAANRAALTAVLSEIEAMTGLTVLDLPIVAAYHIDLGFDLRCA
jgi:DNA-binding Lrp family transcriptional regulator